MLPQQYCLRWKYHHSNLQTMFSQLLDRGCFCDVTLACEGQLIRAHRVVLCACSTFFDTVLTNYASERDPIIIMKDVTFADIKCLIEFMYKGEINVEHANLASLLKTADDLKIKGLAEVTWRDDEDIPPPPTPQTEFHSPPQSRNRDSHSYEAYGHGHEIQNRSHSPDTELERKTPSPKHTAPATRMPTLTPIPTSAVSIVTAVGSTIDTYLGPKRKRGRPPLDDSYDVFNVRKLGHYSDQGDSSQYLEGSQYHDEQKNHGTTAQRSRPNSPPAGSTVYQQHIQQQKQRLRYRSPRVQHDDDQIDDESATEPEWITSTMEHEQENDHEPKDPLSQAEEGDEELPDIKEENEEISETKLASEKRCNDFTSEYPKLKALKRKNSREDSSQHKSENDDEVEMKGSAHVPQIAEEIETVQAPAKEKSSSSANSTSFSSATINNSSTSSSAANSSSPSSSTSTAHKASVSLHSSHHHHSHHSQHSHSHSHHTSAPPPLHHPHHYGKYVPDGYLINEHGILMTHDFIHAPTVSIPTSSSASASASASNGHHPDDYVDIKMEEFSEAELRLTTEEMSQWQDVIKMDDYLAKGRRPQFWEEPFTRRVLDAIKNKRLEMKKAARILGVSYGTLYGRYREVYGCLKHPYSGPSLRPSQTSSLSAQSRFDIVWPSPKPGQLDIGKIRPKDLSELWTRPQI